MPSVSPERGLSQNTVLDPWLKHRSLLQNIFSVAIVLNFQHKNCLKKLLNLLT